MDLNELVIDLVTPQVKIKRRSSFFNIENSNNFDKDKDNSKRKADYIEKLHKEKKDWIDLIQKTNGKIRELANKEKAVYDSSILSKERRDYLNQSINIPEYLQQYGDYSKRVLYYVKQKEWSQKRLQYCQEQLDDSVTDFKIKLLSTQRHLLPEVARPH